MAPPRKQDGWQAEALQLRENHRADCAKVQAFVAIFEETLPDPKVGKRDPVLALACLALHHLAMDFGTCAGPKTMKIMQGSSVDFLPKAYGDYGPRVDFDD